MYQEGPLSKWTNVMQGWQYRWFVLDEYNGVLSYYTSKEKMSKGVRRGCVRLKHAILGIDSEDDSTFTVKVDHKTFHFQARDADEREQWTRALEFVIRLQNHGSNKVLMQRYKPNLPEFEKRLTESDAYLQLLLEQIKALRTKRDQLKGTGRAKLDAIIERAEQMTEYIKHALVILQIAKNECMNPRTPFEEGPVLDLNAADPRVAGVGYLGNDEVRMGAQPAREVAPDLAGSVNATRPASKIPSHVEQRFLDADDARISSRADILPWVSYSSDDEYYDAEDTFDHSKSTQQHIS
ncbi:oxysterol-binding protein-related protein 9-like [Paramacrobiotus metropolitanus]|uniref:oxysterol-binding protein-related protein 9-like n=1 Tax=Paramacrobiotus metropolitanus TaxID=2943436 RepID=UPI002446241B|nr:oxysterol-binding protein-related protein 9-like [Paramacrobiotus metropolitanus]